MFSFQTTPLRFIASLLPWQTKQLAESYLFLISLHFLHFLFFFLFVVFFFSRLDSERADSGWEGEERQVRQRKPLGVGSPGTAFEKAR